MDSSEYTIIAVLAVFVLYGLGNFIASRIITRRFFRERGFIDQGRSLLTSPKESELLEPLATSRLYRGQHKGHTVEHCLAYPQNRRTLTLSKARRKFNQSRWSLTSIESEKTLPDFVLLPAADVSTALRMLNDPGVDLSDDDAFVTRYYFRCESPDKVKPLIFGELREFLLQKELISVECVENTILIKRNWPDEKLKIRFLEELDCAVVAVEKLAT